MNEKNLKEKTEILSEVISLTASLYERKGLTSLQKAFLETLIGAGIWYLPKDKNVLFSGKISKLALAQLQIDPKNTKLVEEHGKYPRKVSGRALYTEYLDEIRKDGSRLVELYLNEMGKFNYVLKIENTRLSRFQRTDKFIDEETAYRLAGIEMVAITLEEVNRLLRRKE